MNLMSGLSGLAGFGNSFVDAQNRSQMMDLQRQEMEMRRQQAEQAARMADRAQMQDMTNSQAMMQALNPLKAAESSGMGNRDISRRMALPDAATQIKLNDITQKSREGALQRNSLAWFFGGGEQKDPDGKQFAQRFGVSPYEYLPPAVLTAAENRANQRMMQQERLDNMRMMANMRGGGDGGGESYRFMPMVGPDGTTRIMAINPKDPYAAPIEVGKPPQKAGETPGGLLPLDASARKALAEWVASAADASRVADSLDKAMGAEIDKQTGQKKYQEQPDGIFSGGTGLVLGVLPDKLQSRVDPGGVSLRSSISNFSSQIMNTLSGAAVSEQERKRLESFLPTKSDDWPTLRQKMDDYKGFLRSKGEALQSTYGGHAVLNRGMDMLGNAASPNKVGPRPGTIIDGYEYLGGDPNDPGAWRQKNGQ